MWVRIRLASKSAPVSFKWMSGVPFFFFPKHSSLMSCPKSKLLMSYRDYIKSHWCFLNFLKWFEQFTKIHTFFRKFKVGKKYWHCTIIAFKITSRQILWISIKYLDNIVMLDKKLVRDACLYKKDKDYQFSPIREYLPILSHL